LTPEEYQYRHADSSKNQSEDQVDSSRGWKEAMSGEVTMRHALSFPLYVGESRSSPVPVSTIKRRAASTGLEKRRAACYQCGLE